MIIRADASPQIGTGHVMRCIALAQHWQDAGGHAVFVMAMDTPSLKMRLRSERIEVIYLSTCPGSIDDAKKTVDIAKAVSASWTIIDGYHFGAGYQKIIRNSGVRLLLIDDVGLAEHYYADIVLNQNLHAKEDSYKNREPYTQLLLGTRFVLLRREFSKWRGWRRKIPETARKILVTMGGSDPYNVNQKIIQAIQQVIVDKTKVIMVAADNSYYGKLKSIARYSGINIQLKKNVTDMSKLMAWSDMGISAGGTTSWEFAFMGVPMLLLAIADNQRQVVKHFCEVGAAVSLGWYENLTLPELAQEISKLLKVGKTREELSRCAQELVDGMGAYRVLEQMKVVGS